jgi:hypothetical protein
MQGVIKAIAMGVGAWLQGKRWSPYVANPDTTYAVARFKGCGGQCESKIEGDEGDHTSHLLSLFTLFVVEHQAFQMLLFLLVL